MNPHRLAQIHARRERLLVKAAAQREEVALLVAPLRTPLAIADRGVAVAAYVRGHPELVAIAVAALVVLSPKRALRWARRGLALWRGYRWVANALHFAQSAQS